ncbi:MAG: TonB family protein [Pyrinomonadaceae bacterium]|nr:TonB family protein [Pyrinomonadaceae bacterium]
MKNLTIFALLILVFASATISAQTDTPKTISGGVVNGKAVSLPVPEYPAAAAAVGASGAVSIKVLIDTEGKVVEADAISGHPLLRSAAESAARKAKFNPTELSGVPVKVSGTLVYNFNCPFADKSKCTSESPKIGAITRIGTSDTPSFPTRTLPAEGSGGGTINGGVVSGKALNLPAPKYPAAAAAVGAVGSVKVQVLINEDGNVVSATAVEGHPLLRSSAEKAAMASVFRPTLLEGRPVKVAGIINYVFGNGKKDADADDAKPLTMMGLGASLQILKLKGPEQYSRQDRFYLNSLPLMSTLPSAKTLFEPLNQIGEKTTKDQADAVFESVFGNLNSELDVSGAWQLGFGRKLSEVVWASRSGAFDVNEVRSKLQALEVSLAYGEKDLPANFVAKAKELTSFARNDDLSEDSVKTDFEAALAAVVSIAARATPSLGITKVP